MSDILRWGTPATTLGLGAVVTIEELD